MGIKVFKTLQTASTQWTFILLFHWSDYSCYPSIDILNKITKVGQCFCNYPIISMYFAAVTFVKKKKGFFLYSPLGSFLFISVSCKQHCGIWVIERAFLYIFIALKLSPDV